MLSFAKNIGKKLFNDVAEASESIKSYIHKDNPGINNLEVTVEDDVVSISGDAESAAALEKAVLMAGNVKGVSEVHSDAVTAPAAIEKPRVDNVLIKALARAFRWKKMLESGQFATITELAEHEKLAFSYMTRVLRLSLLAPDIVEMILDGRQPLEMTLARLLDGFPVEWEGQREIFSL